MAESEKKRAPNKQDIAAPRAGDALRAAAPEAPCCMKVAESAVLVIESLKSAEETKALGRAIGNAVLEQCVIALLGPLGAGKTCLVQGAGEALAIKEQINSPTFTTLNEYHSGRLPLYHFDLYRMMEQSGEERLDARRARGTRPERSAMTSKTSGVEEGEEPSGEERLDARRARGTRPERLYIDELEEFLCGPALVMIEWAEPIRPYLPADHLLIEMNYDHTEGRRVTLTAGGEQSARLIREISNRFISK